MAKSTITREESVQAVFDLKVGYRLGFADIEILKRVARMALAAMDSEPVEMPLDYLQGHKDGLEWAAQLAEANHPETGDWLYDDPIELAKAIRKGPDMPPSQPTLDTEPVAYTDERNLGYIDRGRETAYLWGKQNSEAGDVPLYRHAQQPVVPPMQHWEELCREHPDMSIGDAIIRAAWWNHCRAAMIQAGYSVRDLSTPVDPQVAEYEQNVMQDGNSPVTPDTWIPVSERLPEVGGRYWCYVEEQNSLGKSHYQWNCSWNGEIWGGAMMYGRVTHWMPLPAAPQEDKP